MTTKTSSAVRLALGAMAATGLLVCAGQGAATTPAAACVGAGVVTRIVGDPQTLSIARGATRVTRPRVLEVVCVGDHISVTGATRVTLSLDGRGAVTVSAAAPFAVAARAGAPTLAGNAYRAVNDQVMPDMKRMPWNVRLRADEPFAFALTNLPAGNQRLAPGTRPLLVRVLGGRGPYRITLANASGQTVAEASGGDGNLHLPPANLTSGRYHLTARDSGGGAVEADITVAPRAEAEPATYQAISDPEVRAAATAAAIARQRAATSALEAEQLLAAAPINGLDRGAVYDLIESYGAE